MFRIRIHGRGGQGIKTAGRILGTAFFRAGYEVQDAPVYGAERRGAPMFACVRAGREPIRERGLITRPDLVVIADDTLVGIPAAKVLLGIGKHTVVLIQSALEEANWRTRLGISNPILVLPGRALNQEAGEPLAGATCAGAAARLVGTIPRETLAQALREEVSSLGAEILERNLEHALAAFDAVTANAGIVVQTAGTAASDYIPPEWINLPFDPAQLSAPDIYAAATSVEVRTGLWRTMRPVIDYARCNHCAWICSTFCPDSAIALRADGAPEIDFDHCKGCLICVAVCPPHAISALPERAVPATQPAREGS